MRAAGTIMAIIITGTTTTITTTSTSAGLADTGHPGHITAEDVGSQD